MRFCGKAQLPFAGVRQLGSIHKVLWWKPHRKSRFFCGATKEILWRMPTRNDTAMSGSSSRTPFAFQKPEIR
jgi:hypothetical protein